MLREKGPKGEQRRRSEREEAGEEQEREEKPFMPDLTLGTTYVLEPADNLLRLIQQYDYFMITYGIESFLQIRVPTKWVKLEVGEDGVSYLTCRNKRKRDGHLFEIYGNKFFFEVGYNADCLKGKLKSDLSEEFFFVSMWNKNDVATDNE